MKVYAIVPEVAGEVQKIIGTKFVAAEINKIMVNFILDQKVKELKFKNNNEIGKVLEEHRRQGYQILFVPESEEEAETLQMFLALRGLELTPD